MASLWSSADWACMACSWWAADMGGGRPPGRSRGYGVPGGETKKQNKKRFIIITSGRAQFDRVDVIFLVMRDCIGAYQRLGGAAFRVHVAAGRGEGWGWRQEGKGSGPGEVQLPGDLLPGDGPPNLEDTQDIHHHLLGVRVFGSGHSHFKIMYHTKCMLHKLQKHCLM